MDSQETLVGLLEEARRLWEENEDLPEFDVEKAVWLYMCGPYAVVPLHGEGRPLIVVAPDADYDALVGEGWERVKKELQGDD